jgi:hypothetical protein
MSGLDGSILVMPKIRYGARCGRCHIWIRPGGMAVRQYGRWWHVRCAVEYLRERAALKQHAAV